MRSLTGLLLVVLLVSVISACGGGDDRAVTVNGGNTTASGDPGTASSSAAGNALSKAEAKKALLTVQDMPTGWAEAAPEEDDESESTVTPKKCAKLLKGLDTTLTDAKTKVSVSAFFNKGGAFGTQLEQTISSFEKPVDDDAFSKIAEAMSTCGTFQVTTADDETTTMTVHPLSFPELGEGTLALKVAAESEQGQKFGIVWLMIRSGHNMVGFSVASITGVNVEALETIARTALDNLEEVAAG